MASPPSGLEPPMPTPQRVTPSKTVQRVDRLVDAFRSWGWVMLLVGLAPGVAIWPLLHLDEFGFVLTGELDMDLRREMLLAAASSLFGVVAYYAIAYAALRRRTSDLRFGDAAASLNRFTFVIIALPLLVAVLHRGMETEQRSLTLVLITICSVMFGVWLYRLLGLRAHRWSVPETTRGGWGAHLAVFGLFLFYAGYMSYLALLDHRNLGTHVYDLGIYDNIFWHNANGDFMGCSYCKTGKHMSSHFDPILWVFSPIYRLYQRAETILVLQAVWLATGVVPLYLLAKRRLKNAWFGVLLAAAYVAYPALHGANLFDFHSLTLVIPSLLWAIYFIDSGAFWRYWLALALMLITREDISLLACFVGAYALFQRRNVIGLGTIFVSLAYLATIKMFVMNDPGLIMSGGQESTSFHHFYKEMIPNRDEGARGIIITALTNPAFALQVFLKEDKVFFFLALLLPTLFLPLLAGRKTVMMLYGLVFIGLASRPHMFSLHFQYSSVLFPVLLAALPDGLDRASNTRLPAAYGVLPRRLQWALMGTVVFTTVLVSVKFGALVPNASFKAGWNHIVRAPDEEIVERYRWVRRAIEKYIPPDASVSSSSGLGPHISNRAEAHKWPTTKGADFLLLHTEHLSKKSKTRLDRLTNSGKYRKVTGKYGIELFQRVPPEERPLSARPEISKRKNAAAKERAADTMEPETLDTGGDADSDNPRAQPLHEPEDDADLALDPPEPGYDGEGRDPSLEE